MITYEALCAQKLRGEQTFTHEGKVLSGFVCHGCQSCWSMDEAENLSESYPHFLSPLVEVNPTKEPS